MTVVVNVCSWGVTFGSLPGQTSGKLPGNVFRSRFSSGIFVGCNNKYVFGTLLGRIPTPIVFPTSPPPASQPLWPPSGGAGDYLPETFWETSGNLPGNFLFVS